MLIEVYILAFSRVGETPKLICLSVISLSDAPATQSFTLIFYAFPTACRTKREF